MFNDPELYQLSFVSSKRKSRISQLVFTIRVEHASEIAERLSNLAGRWDHTVLNYLHKSAEFSNINNDPNLLGEIWFGYEEIGTVVKEGELLHLHIPLLPDELLHLSTLTIQIVAFALGVPIESNSTTRRQQVMFQTRCEYPVAGWGHLVTGSASSDLISWIRNLTKEQDYNLVPKEVLKAMRNTWVSTTTRKEAKRWASDCRGWLYKDGRFQLTCLGNACSLGIDPYDLWTDHENDTCPSAQISCHNLDGAHQQVTLLAGLAKMAELARQRE